MISFEQPALLLAAVPWLLFWGWLVRTQETALAALRHGVSDRFRPLFSRYRVRSLRLHMAAVLALGLVAVVAAARPAVRGGVEAAEERGRLLLLIDGSASMYASDVEAVLPGEEAPAHRFELARRIALEMVRELEGFRFAVATYSGAATVNLPMSGDPHLVEETLRTLDTHNYYRSTGSRLSGALDVAFHFTEKGRRELQVLVIGDGELPNEDDYDDAVRALADQQIPVHALTVGSTEGQSRIIYDFRDVVAGKPPEERTVLQRYTTRRTDEHLRRIARSTGGRFAVASAQSLPAVAQAIQDHPASSRRIEVEAARTDASALPLALFLAGFVAHLLWLGVGRRPPAIEFEVDRIGVPGGVAAARRRGAPPAAAALLLSTLGLLGGGCGDSPLQRAHRANERGIALDLVRRHTDAQPHYERSIGYRLQPHVPTHNLARSLTLEERFSEAHDLFQDALLLAPELPEAHYNDGIALYRWGSAELDPAGCQLDRTRELWQGAFGRFAAAAELADDAGLQHDARANLEAVSRALAAIDALIAEPPPHCLQPPPPAAGGGGGGGEDESGARGGENQEDPGQEEEAGGEESEEDPTEEDAAGQDEEREDEGGGGGSPPPGDEPPPPPASEEPAKPPPLSGEELERIQGELERIAAQAAEDGKYHRRTRSEQFDKESWSDPDTVIWW